MCVLLFSTANSVKSTRRDYFFFNFQELLLLAAAAAAVRTIVSLLGVEENEVSRPLNGTPLLDNDDSNPSPSAAVGEMRANMRR